MKKVVSFAISAGAISLVTIGSAAANHGNWRFDPARCPDLVEDARDRQESRRDERVNRGPRDRAEDRRDRRESKRDERVTKCPASAWVWDGADSRNRPKRPNRIVVYYDHAEKAYFRRDGERTRVRIIVR